MFRQKQKTRQFILGKSPRNSLNGRERLQYRKNVEKALVVSILAMIVFFRLTAHFDVEQYLAEKNDIVFETVDLPEPPPVIEEPPKMQMEQVVEIPPQEEEVLSPEDEILKEIEDLLDDGSDEEQLQLASNDVGDYLLSDSQLGSVSGPEMTFRQSRNRDARLNVGGAGNRNFEDGAGLDIGKTESTSRRSLDSGGKGPELDIGKNSSPAGNRNQEGTVERQTPRLGLTGKNTRVLSFASSTIGTEDYKLWNKLNAELDRLNKGRYGHVPSEIERHRRGFIIRFTFSDNIKHEIHWQQDGNVWIEIVGESNKSDLQELRRSVTSLLRLSIEN